MKWVNRRDWVMGGMIEISCLNDVMVVVCFFVG